MKKFIILALAAVFVLSFTACAKQNGTTTPSVPPKGQPQNALEILEKVPKAQASEIDDAASLMHMLNQNNFSCGVYHVKNSGNAETLAGKIKENILARQWLCGFPEKLVILNVGDYIVSVFGAAELTNTFTEKLSAEYSSAKQLFDVPIA